MLAPQQRPADATEARTRKDQTIVRDSRAESIEATAAAPAQPANTHSNFIL